MELHSTVIFPVLKKPGGLHCHILSIWFGSVEGLDRSTPRATWYMILLGGWTIHHKMWKLLVALGTMQHTLERRTYFKSPSPTQYLSWIAIGQLHTSPLYIYNTHMMPQHVELRCGFHLPGQTRSRVCFWFFEVPSLEVAGISVQSQRRILYKLTCWQFLDDSRGKHHSSWSQCGRLFAQAW